MIGLHRIPGYSVARTIVEWILGFGSLIYLQCFGSSRIVVLAYHSIGNSPWIHAISRESFHKQVAWLSKFAEVVSIDEVGVVLSKKIKRSRIPKVVITFDDGYADWIENALPVLKEYNVPATFFITTSFRSVTSAPHDFLTPLSMRDVEILVNNNFVIGGHGHTHRDLSVCTEAELRFELMESKRILTELSHQEINHVSYPKGRYPSDLKIIDEIGYLFAFAGHGSVRYGTNRLIIPRVPVTKNISQLRYILRIFRAAVYSSI